MVLTPWNLGLGPGSDKAKAPQLSFKQRQFMKDLGFRGIGPAEALRMS